MKKKPLTPVAAALGTTFAVSLSASPMVNAAENPFSMNELPSGYMVAEEGTCGNMPVDEEATADESTAAPETKPQAKAEEGKCGEGKCGEKRKMHNGKCGEGKCGPNGPPKDK